MNFCELFGVGLIGTGLGFTMSSDSGVGLQLMLVGSVLWFIGVKGGKSA